MFFIPNLQFLQRVGDALDEMGLLLDQPPKAVGAKHLQQTQVHEIRLVSVEFDFFGVDELL